MDEIYIGLPVVGSKRLFLNLAEWCGEADRKSRGSKGGLEFLGKATAYTSPYQSLVLRTPSMVAELLLAWNCSSRQLA